MNNKIFLVLILCMITLNIFCQEIENTVSDNWFLRNFDQKIYSGYNGLFYNDNADILQDDSASEIVSVDISTEYNLSYLNFSTKSKDAQSILTWRDMYLHGGRAEGEIETNADIFNKAYIGAEYAKSFNGNWMDDDSHNANGYIGVTDSEVAVWDFDLALGNDNGVLSKKIGLDFTSLNFHNYNYRHLAQAGKATYPDTSGTINTYDQYMFGFFGDVQARLVDSPYFYANLDGRVGLALGTGVGNWLLRSDLKHPESFRSTGLFLRAGGSAEIGFKIKMFTVFLGVQADYEISPWLSNLEMYYKNGYTHKQGLFQDLSRASFNAGLKAGF